MAPQGLTEPSKHIPSRSQYDCWYVFALDAPRFAIFRRWAWVVQVASSQHLARVPANFCIQSKHAFIDRRYSSCPNRSRGLANRSREATNLLAQYRFNAQATRARTSHVPSVSSRLGGEKMTWWLAELAWKMIDSRLDLPKYEVMTLLNHYLHLGLDSALQARVRYCPCQTPRNIALAAQDFAVSLHSVPRAFSGG